MDEEEIVVTMPLWVVESVVDLLVACQEFISDIEEGVFILPKECAHEFLLDWDIETAIEDLEFTEGSSE